MKFITLKTSATGKKLAAVQKKIAKAITAQKAMAKKYDIVQWRPGYWCVAGRFSAVMFAPDKVVDKKVWKNVNGSRKEWMPKLNNIFGKTIQGDFDTLPKVSSGDLNSAIGFDGEPFKTIGFTMHHKKYYGIEAGDNWDIKKPADCKEVTVTEYKKLFDKKGK